jgi:2,3-bisphosphoglycerate-dependent phosphoglycerate mutase
MFNKICLSSLFASSVLFSADLVENKNSGDNFMASSGISSFRDAYASDRVNILFVEIGEGAYPDGKKVLLGTSEFGLSEKGKSQAQALAQQLEKAGMVFHKVYSSTLARGFQTAEPLLRLVDENGIKMLEMSPALNETCKGDLELKTPEEYRQMASYKEYNKTRGDEKVRFFVPMGEGGESKADRAVELIAFVNALRSDASLKGKTVAVVTHGNPFKILHTLSVNPDSLQATHQDELRSSLDKVYAYNDPEKCAVVYYQADESSFDYQGKLGFSDDGSALLNDAVYPGYKE